MVKITNGTNVFEVTRGAFDDIYSKQGYSLLGDKAEEHVEEHHEDNAGNELTEKPIAQWSKAEVKSFAAEHNIDISGTKNVGEAKELIKSYLAECE